MEIKLGFHDDHRYSLYNGLIYYIFTVTVLILIFYKQLNRCANGRILVKRGLNYKIRKGQNARETFPGHIIVDTTKYTPLFF